MKTETRNDLNGRKALENWSRSEFEILLYCTLTLNRHRNCSSIERITVSVKNEMKKQPLKGRYLSIRAQGEKE